MLARAHLPPRIDALCRTRPARASIVTVSVDAARLRDLALLRRVRDRIDREYAELGSEVWWDVGAEIVQEPIDQDSGVRDCAVRDPAGNLIRIQQR